MQDHITAANPPPLPADGRPPKPYPGFQLFAHAKGGWCKKIDGKHRSFGPWRWPDPVEYEASWKAAVAKYNRFMAKRLGGSNIVAAGHRKHFGRGRRGFSYANSGDAVSVTKFLRDKRAIDPLRTAMAADSIRAVFDALHRDSMRLQDYLAGGCSGTLPADLIDRVRTIAGKVGAL